MVGSSKPAVNMLRSDWSLFATSGWDSSAFAAGVAAVTETSSTTFLMPSTPSAAARTSCFVFGLADAAAEQDDALIHFHVEREVFQSTGVTAALQSGHDFFCNLSIAAESRSWPQRGNRSDRQSEILSSHGKCLLQFLIAPAGDVLQSRPQTFAGLSITGGTTPAENPHQTGVAVDFGDCTELQVGFFGFCRRIKTTKP